VGAGCTIEGDVSIRGSIICADVHIGAGSEVVNSFIAPGTRVAANTKIIGNYYSNELISPLNL